LSELKASARWASELIGSAQLSSLVDKYVILQPLLGLHQARQRGSSLVVVIDALDECEREEHIRAILQLLARTKDIQPVPLRIVVTSRPELHIRLGFK
jgi:hypothetical protein